MQNNVNTQDLYKSLYKTGVVAYAVLFVMAIFFYEERAVFLDIAYHLFHILKDGTFAIQNNRYGAVITQIFPLLCQKAGLPLQTTMLIYTTGFVLYYFTCYWICGSLLKQYSIALCLLLMHTLFITDTFFWIQSELPQGMAMLMVMTALINSTKPAKENMLRLIFLLPVITFTIFFHPLLWIPTVFIFIYFAINQHYVSSKIIFYTGFLAFFLLYYIKHQVLTAAYDAHAMKAGNRLWELFPNWVNIASNKVFIKNCFGNFSWISICFVMICLAYVLQRKWLQLLLFPGAFLSYLLLINTAYADGKTPGFYIENLYLPLSIYIAIPLVHDVLPSLKKRSISQILLALILISAVTRISINSKFYTKRLNWEKAYLEQNSGRKQMVALTPAMQQILVMPWGTPYEFWLLSTIQTGKTESIIITANVARLEYAHWDRMSFITDWGVYSYSELPKPYFVLTDTFQRYTVIK